MVLTIGKKFCHPEEENAPKGSGGDKRVYTSHASERQKANCGPKEVNVAILQGALRSLNLRPVRLVSRLPILVFLAGTMIVPSARGQQTISASRDQTGQHPATASLPGDTHVKCLTAKSDVPNPQPEPGCHVDAPDRVSVDLKVGSSTHFSRTGTMTLTCTGQGNLRCTAEVKRSGGR